MLDYIRAIWQGNPVRVVSVTTSIAVFALAKAGIVIDEQNVGEALTIALPILLGGELARQKVSPYVGEVGPPSDAVLEREMAAVPKPGPIS